MKKKIKQNGLLSKIWRYRLFFKGLVLLWIGLNALVLPSKFLAAQSCDPQDEGGAVSGYAMLEGQSVHTGIFLQLFKQGEGLNLNTLTNSAGFYCLKWDIPPGSYQIRATISDYQLVFSNSFQVVAGKTTTAPNILLKKSTGGLEGFVLLSNQSNHSGTVVEIQGTTFSTTTVQDGLWYFNDVPVLQGGYTIWASHDCYGRARIHTDAYVNAGQVGSFPVRTLQLDRNSDCEVWCCVDGKVRKATLKECNEKRWRYFFNSKSALTYCASIARALAPKWTDSKVKESLQALHIVKLATENMYQLKMKEIKTALDTAQVRENVTIELETQNQKTIKLGTYKPDIIGTRASFRLLPETKSFKVDNTIFPNSRSCPGILKFKKSSGVIMAKFNVTLQLDED